MEPTLSPTPIPFNLYVDAECGDVTSIHGAIAQTAAAMTKAGTGTITELRTEKKYFLTRLPGGVFTLAMTQGPLPPRMQQSDIERQGPELWRQMHTGMLELETPAERERLVAQIHATLPCGDCKKHFTALLEAMPMDCGTAESAFAWSVAAHNATNQRIGKPAMTLEAARKMWSL